MARIMALSGMSPALWTFSRTVVMPKAMRPSGPGLAVASRSVAVMVPRSPIGPVALASGNLISSLI